MLSIVTPRVYHDVGVLKLVELFSILSRAPTTTIKSYQTVQNFAARIAYRSQEERMSTHACKNCIGLPIKYRTKYKLLTIVYNGLQGQAPQSLKEKLKHRNFPRTTRQSTSSSITLDIPFNKKKSFADRGFSYTAAKYWDDLPECIRRVKDIKHFKSLLKPHFFTLAFPMQ